MVGKLPTTPLDFATLTGHRGIKRVLAWQPQGQRRIGRPKYSWDSMATNFTAGRIYLHWRSLQLMLNFGVHACLIIWSFAGTDVYGGNTFTNYFWCPKQAAQWAIEG